MNEKTLFGYALSTVRASKVAFTLEIMHPHAANEILITFISLVTTLEVFKLKSGIYIPK